MRPPGRDGLPTALDIRSDSRSTTVGATAPRSPIPSGKEWRSRSSRVSTSPERAGFVSKTTSWLRRRVSSSSRPRPARISRSRREVRSPHGRRRLPRPEPGDPCCGPSRGQVRARDRRVLGRLEGGSRRPEPSAQRRGCRGHPRKGRHDPREFADQSVRQGDGCDPAPRDLGSTSVGRAHRDRRGRYALGRPRASPSRRTRRRGPENDGQRRRGHRLDVRIPFGLGGGRGRSRTTARHRRQPPPRHRPRGHGSTRRVGGSRHRSCGRSRCHARSGRTVRRGGAPEARPRCHPSPRVRAGRGQRGNRPRAATGLGRSEGRVRARATPRARGRCRTRPANSSGDRRRIPERPDRTHPTGRPTGVVRPDPRNSSRSVRGRPGNRRSIRRGRGAPRPDGDRDPARRSARRAEDGHSRLARPPPHVRRVGSMAVRALWYRNGTLHLIDQRELPGRLVIRHLRRVREVAGAIRSMAVRGAPAIGVAAAYGMVLAHREGSYSPQRAAKLLRATRPTAHDLFVGIETVRSAWASKEDPLAAADRYREEIVEECHRIGIAGAPLLARAHKVLTHCNAGALATVEWGTALAPIRVARDQGADLFVWVDETRPLLQGSRLTAWELAREKIPHAIIVDNAAGPYMRAGEVDAVIVGADRIARNGDFANKIGTYEKAVVARENGIPFYVAAPWSTFDPERANG